MSRLHRVSYLMGELLDSSDETRITVSAYRRRVRAYLATLGRRIDICTPCTPAPASGSARSA